MTFRSSRQQLVTYRKFPYIGHKERPPKCQLFPTSISDRKANQKSRDQGQGGQSGVGEPHEMGAAAVEGPPMEDEPELPPDGGYRWVCVASCFTINCFTWDVVSVSSNV